MKSLIYKLLHAPKKTVVVIGDVMVDEYIFGSVTRISPEAPVPIVREQRKERYLGGAANVAANCVVLGLDVTLIGVVGAHDGYGKELDALLAQHGITGRGIVHSATRATTVKKRVIAQNSQCLRIDHEDAHVLSSEEQAALVEQLERAVAAECVVLVSDYAKGVITPELLEQIKRIAHNRGALVIADPKGTHVSKYHGIDYLKPNASEFKQLVQAAGIAGESFIEQARALGQLLDLKGIIVTQGERGIQFVSRDEALFSPAFKQEVYDLSGAGDTVFAYVAFGLVHGLAMSDILMLANKAASIAIAHLKTYAVRLKELLSNQYDYADKIIEDWVVLKESIDDLKQAGKRIVFTNGCFDILHAGHVRCLHEAKKQGDILIVALNTEGSVRRQSKGPERPINSLADRMATLAGLASVDFVTQFDQDTPQEILDLLQPDILVKGGDYKAESVVGYKEIVARGGAVVIIPLVPGKSTTKIVQKSRESGIQLG